jgi:hypothetical protein
MTIYDIASIVKQSLPNALTPKNIKSGFLVTGTWPFNRDIFAADDFLPYAVTVRPLQDSQNLTRSSECHTSDSYSDISNQPSTSGLKQDPLLHKEIDIMLVLLKSGHFQIRGT